jgi:hypothetical protein
VDGVTYIKFTRKLQTSDPTFADACLSADQRFIVIYAYGQLTTNKVHKPSSTLEIMPPSKIANSNFYHADVLKYHGGGSKGAGFDSRGSFGAVDLFSASSSSPSARAATADTDCQTPSTLPAYTCMTVRHGGALTVHYSVRGALERTANPRNAALGATLHAGSTANPMPPAVKALHCDHDRHALLVVGAGHCAWS